MYYVYIPLLELHTARFPSHCYWHVIPHPEHCSIFHSRYSNFQTEDKTRKIISLVLNFCVTWKKALALNQGVDTLRINKRKKHQSICSFV
jgi:hypothetical protein